MNKPELMPTNHRVEAFSDAVFAIVATIMMFEIRIPDSLAFDSDPAALGHVASLVATYVLSFVAVAILWTNHHYLTFTVRNPDRAAIWLNNQVLFSVSAIPVVARFFGMNPTSPKAAATYGFVLMMCTASFSSLRLHASRIAHEAFHRAIHRRVLRKSGLGIAIYAASVPAAFVSIRLAWLCFLVVPAMFFLPTIRRPSRRMNHSANSSLGQEQFQ